MIHLMVDKLPDFKTGDIITYQEENWFVHALCPEEKAILIGKENPIDSYENV